MPKQKQTIRKNDKIQSRTNDHMRKVENLEQQNHVSEQTNIHSLYSTLSNIVDQLPGFMITHSLYWQLKGLKKCVEFGPVQNVSSPESCTGESFYIEDAWKSCTKLILSQTAANMSIETFQNRSRVLFNDLAFQFIKTTPFYTASV